MLRRNLLLKVSAGMSFPAIAGCTETPENRTTTKVTTTPRNSSNDLLPFDPEGYTSYYVIENGEADTTDENDFEDATSNYDFYHRLLIWNTTQNEVTSSLMITDADSGTTKMDEQVTLSPDMAFKIGFLEPAEHYEVVISIKNSNLRKKFTVSEDEKDNQSLTYVGIFENHIETVEQGLV